jgi:hypothetical protein
VRAVPLPSETWAIARGLLEPREDIEYLFPAVLLKSMHGQVFIAVTRRSIVVLTAGLFGRSRPRKVLARLPRRARFSLLEGGGSPAFSLDGLVYEIEEEYLAVVSACNRGQATGDALPPDPLPNM